MIKALVVVGVVVLVVMVVIIVLGVVAVKCYPDPLDYDLERL